MHVYFFGVYNAQGGMENYALNLISGMKEKYSDVDFTLLVFSDVFSGKDVYMENNYCDYIVLPHYLRHPIRFLKAFKGIGKKVKPSDIIQLNVCTLRNFLLFCVVSKINCRKMIVSHYSKNDDGLAILHYITRWIYGKKYQKLAVSDVAGKFMFNNGYVVIPNGVVSEKYEFNQELRNKIREQYGIDEDTFLIGHVGRITKEKNQSFSVKVLKRICMSHENVKLMLVGKYYDDGMKELINENELSEKVILTGPVYEDIGSYYSAFDCFILPSKNEAMGIALVEALCNGLPIVYSKNVPSLELDSCKMDNSTFIQLDLDEDLWTSTIERIINSTERSRTNYIKDTQYELARFIDNYHDFYLGYE